MEWVDYAMPVFLWRHRRKLKQMNGRLRRHFSMAQEHAHGAAWHTLHYLVKHHVVQENEVELAAEALEQLCEENVIDSSGNRYYLHGYAPCDLSR